MYKSSEAGVLMPSTLGVDMEKSMHLEIAQFCERTLYSLVRRCRESRMTSARHATRQLNTQKQRDRNRQTNAESRIVNPAAYKRFKQRKELSRLGALASIGDTSKNGSKKQQTTSRENKSCTENTQSLAY